MVIVDSKNINGCCNVSNVKAFIHLDTCEFPGSPTNIIMVFLPKSSHGQWQANMRTWLWGAGEQWPSNSHRRLVGIIDHHRMLDHGIYGLGVPSFLTLAFEVLMIAPWYPRNRMIYTCWGCWWISHQLGQQFEGLLGHQTFLQIDTTYGLHQLVNIRIQADVAMLKVVQIGGPMQNECPEKCGKSESVA